MNSRSSVLLALSTGMIMGLVALPFLPKTKAPALPPAVQPVALAPVLRAPVVPAPALLSPTAMAVARLACVDSVDGFMAALVEGSRADYESYLTSPAVLGLDRGSGLSLNGSGIEVFEVGEARLDGMEAFVPVVLNIRGQMQYMDLHLRQEDGQWSIFGTSLNVGEEHLMIDFEDGKHAMGSIAKELMASLGAGPDPEPEAGMGMADSKIQAEPLMALQFEGKAPVAIDFVGIADRSDPQFTRVELGIVNQSNKDIVKVEANFHYLGAGGEALDSFPHTLSGPIGFQGQAPLALVDGERINNVTAFFMPEGTTQVRVEVLEVLFGDHSTWPVD